MTVEQKAEEIMMQKVIKHNDCIMTPCKTLEDCQLIDFCFENIVDAFIDGYHECEKEHEWHFDGVPDITHKSCLVNVDYLPNIMLCFWNGEVWIESRTLERVKKVKAWKYVDFPQELNNGKERT